MGLGDARSRNQAAQFAAQIADAAQQQAAADEKAAFAAYLARIEPLVGRTWSAINRRKLLKTWRRQFSNERRRASSAGGNRSVTSHRLSVGAFVDSGSGGWLSLSGKSLGMFSSRPLPTGLRLRLDV